MKIDYDALKKIVENTKFKDGERLSYSGVKFLLFPGKYTERDMEEHEYPIFFLHSSVVDWDIYFAINVVPEDFRKPCLLHEILEGTSFIHLRHKLKLPYDEAYIKAHKIAVKYDKKYAKEILSNNRFEEYKLLRGKLRNINHSSLISSVKAEP